MRIYKTLKPTQVLNCPVNKQTLMKHILKETWGCDTKNVYGNVHFVKGVLCVRAFNLVKHNRKVVRLGGDVYKKNGEKHVLKPMYWEAFVYDIPVTMLEYMNLYLIQYERNFKIVELD